MSKDKKRDIALPNGSLPESESSKSYFLGIGINKYQDFESLSNAVADVKVISKLIQERYDLDESIFLFDEEATRDNIISTLDRLVKTLDNDDKLILYYSGHGHLDESTGFAFWIPHNATKGSSSQYIRNSTIRDYLKAIRARHTLLISDSCFSGSLFVEGTTRSTSALDELEKRVSRWAICSGRHDEEVYDGKPGGHSPFAESIMEALSENNRPRLNVAKLADRVMELTSSQYRQLPMGGRLFDVGDKGGQYIFRLKTDLADIVAPSKPERTAIYQKVPTVVHQDTQTKTTTKRPMISIGGWWGLILAYLVGIILFFVLMDALAIDLFEAFPYFLLPAPFFPGIWRRLSRKPLLISTGIFALLYYLLWFLWLSSPDEIPMLLTGDIILLIGVLLISGGLYYFVLPKWNERNV